MKDFAYQFGIHSNIPECCVTYYCEKIAQGITHVGETCRPEYIYNHSDVRYVVCDACDLQVKAGTYRPNSVHYCRNDPTDQCNPFRDVL